MYIVKLERMCINKLCTVHCNDSKTIHGSTPFKMFRFWLLGLTLSSKSSGENVSSVPVISAQHDWHTGDYKIEYYDRSLTTVLGLTIKI
jgi:hypothetical protein